MDTTIQKIQKIQKNLNQARASVLAQIRTAHRGRYFQLNCEDRALRAAVAALSALINRLIGADRRAAEQGQEAVLAARGMDGLG